MRLCPSLAQRVHAGSNEELQGASALFWCIGSGSTSSPKLLTDGSSHIITRFRSVSNCWWQISIFTRHVVNNIFVLPFGTHVGLPGLLPPIPPSHTHTVVPSVVKCEKPIERTELAQSNWSKESNKCKSEESKLGQDFTLSGSTAWSLIVHCTIYLNNLHVWNLNTEHIKKKPRKRNIA